MTKAAKLEASIWGPCEPHVIVVDKDADYAQMLANELQNRSVRAKPTKTVDAFLDLNCRERVDLVSLEIDVMDPHTLDNINLLRTHFGEGPGTRIVASSSFMPGAFSFLVEQRGADTCIAKRRAPRAMADALENELRKKIKSTDIGWAK